jgi:two-component sensor histidine kinase
MKVSSIVRPLRRDRPWWGIGAAAALFGLAVAARWKLADLTEGFGPMLLLPAILLAGVLGGIRVGLGVSAVCFLIAWVWFFPPYGTFILDGRDAAAVVSFIFTAATELYVVRVLSLANDNLFMAKERSTAMFRELQHRVANNLQVVTGVLRQERKRLDRDNPAAQALERAQERLDLMVRVHRSLNSPTIVDSPIESYLQNLGDDLVKASSTSNVHVMVTAAPVQLDVERLMSLSMIVAEAVTNSLKYAFHDRSDGNITVSLAAEGRSYTLMICDDGPGFSQASLSVKRNSLGRGIVESLVSQLRGKLSFECGRGATVRVVFPI